MTQTMTRATLARSAAALALLGLAACTEPVTGDTPPEAGFTTLPPAVVEIAAPYQNLNAARLQSDGCFWYRHEGPVETTMLPLRTAEGNPICARDPGGTL